MIDGELEESVQTVLHNFDALKNQMDSAKKKATKTPKKVKKLAQALEPN